MLFRSHVGGYLVNPVVNVLGGDTGLDMCGNVVQAGNVDPGTFPDLLDLFLVLNEIVGGDDGAVVSEVLQHIVESAVTMLVLLAAAAPAGIVSSSFTHENNILSFAKDGEAPIESTVKTLLSEKQNEKDGRAFLRTHLL